MMLSSGQAGHANTVIKHSEYDHKKKMYSVAVWFGLVCTESILLKERFIVTKLRELLAVYGLHKHGRLLILIEFGCSHSLKNRGRRPFLFF